MKRSKKCRYSLRRTDDPKIGRHFWKPEEILQEIRRRHASKLSLYEKDIRTEDGSLVHAAWNHFRSWRRAIEASGFDFKVVCSQKGKGQKWTMESIPKYLFEHRHDDLSKRAMRRSGIYRMAMKLFGNWRAAIQAANLNYAEVTRADTVHAHKTAYRSRNPVIWASMSGRLVSLHDSVPRHPGLTREHTIGVQDAGYARADSRLTLEVLLREQRAGQHIDQLLRRAIEGEDLTDGEYELVASTVRAKPELLEIFTAT